MGFDNVARRELPGAALIWDSSLTRFSFVLRYPTTELTPHHHHDLPVATGKAQFDLRLDELTPNRLGVVHKGLSRLGTARRQRARNGVFEGFNNRRSVCVCVLEVR